MSPTQSPPPAGGYCDTRCRNARQGRECRQCPALNQRPHVCFVFAGQKSLASLEATCRSLCACLRDHEEQLWSRLLRRDHGIPIHSLPPAHHTPQHSPYRLPDSSRVKYMVECLQGLDMELESIEVRRRVRAPMRSHRAFVHPTSVLTRQLAAWWLAFTEQTVMTSRDCCWTQFRSRTEGSRRYGERVTCDRTLLPDSVYERVQVLSRYLGLACASTVLVRNNGAIFKFRKHCDTRIAPRVSFVSIETALTTSQSLDTNDVLHRSASPRAAGDAPRATVAAGAGAGAGAGSPIADSDGTAPETDNSSTGSSSDDSDYSDDDHDAGEVASASTAHTSSRWKPRRAPGFLGEPM